MDPLIYTMAGLSSLDFQPRLHFEALTHDRFGSLSSTSSFDDAGDFFLLTSFGHSTFRLDEDVVSLILRLVLGGVARDFCVVHQAEWMFRFSVVSKSVGLMIHRLEKVICKSFAIFFTLWRDGNPIFIHEKFK